MSRRTLAITQDELTTAMDYMGYEPTPEGVWGHLEAMTKEAEVQLDVERLARALDAADINSEVQSGDEMAPIIAAEYERLTGQIERR